MFDDFDTQVQSDELSYGWEDDPWDDEFDYDDFPNGGWYYG